MMDVLTWGRSIDRLRNNPPDSRNRHNCVLPGGAVLQASIELIDLPNLQVNQLSHPNDFDSLKPFSGVGHFPIAHLTHLLEMAL